MGDILHALGADGLASGCLGVNIDKSGSNKAALDQINIEGEKGIEIRQYKYLNNLVEQVVRHFDHRQIKKLFRATLGFKNFHCAQEMLTGFELMHMIQKGQMLQTGERTMSPAEQFYSLAA